MEETKETTKKTNKNYYLIGAFCDKINNNF